MTKLAFGSNRDVLARRRSYPDSSLVGMALHTLAGSAGKDAILVAGFALRYSVFILQDVAGAVVIELRAEIKRRDHAQVSQAEQSEQACEASAPRFFKPFRVAGIRFHGFIPPAGLDLDSKVPMELIWMD